MSHRVVFSPEAQEQLAELFPLCRRSGNARCRRAIHGSHRELLREPEYVPLRGTKRDDVRPGLRITHYKKRAVIAFDVDADVVSIIGVFYGGQDYETILQDDPNGSEGSDTAPA